jgi:hypothetical protein
VLDPPEADPGVVVAQGEVETPMPPPPPPASAEASEEIVIENVSVAGEDPVFFSLRDGQIVDTIYEAGDWDVMFEGTNIVFNGEAQLLPLAYDDLPDAPADGYRADDPATPVVPGGSGNGWYRYDPSQHKIRPLDDRTLIYRAPDGRFVKMEILSYYRDGANPATETDEPRYYSFRYRLTGPGSTRF